MGGFPVSSGLGFLFDGVPVFGSSLLLVLLHLDGVCGVGWVIKPNIPPLLAQLFSFSTNYCLFPSVLMDLE